MHRCVCVFGKVSQVNVIEQVNTIWEQLHWTWTKSVNLLQRRSTEAPAKTVRLHPDSVVSNPPSLLSIHLLPCSFQTV